MTSNHNESATFKYKTSIETRFIDFDMFGHLNNSIYFTYIEVARSKYWKEIIEWDWKKTGIVIGRAELDFVSPIFLDDKIYIYVRTSRIGSKSFDLEYEIVKVINGKELLCSKGKTACIAFDYQSQKPIAIPTTHLEKMRAYENID